MLSRTATQVLSTFQQILSDVEVVTQSGSGNAILSKIKNTMSDRHVVEKNFNALLEGYRVEVLPSVIDNWTEISFVVYICLWEWQIQHHLLCCSGSRHTLKKLLVQQLFQMLLEDLNLVLFAL